MAYATTGIGRFSALWRATRRSPNLTIGIVLLLPFVLSALLAPLIAPYDPLAIDVNSRLFPPSLDHLFGTDELGRDLFSRVLYGSRASFLVAIGIVAIGTSGGTVVGTVSGYLGGWVDNALMRIVDVFMAIPFMVIALALTAALGPSLINLVLAIGILSIPVYARIARGLALSLRGQPFVAASKTMGASHSYVMRKHIMPNMVSSMIVIASTGLSGAVLTSSALSFIGLGAQPPMPELGAIISGARSYILDEWWYSLFPGLMLVVAAFGFNLIGDGLRDLLDPRSQASK